MNQPSTDRHGQYQEPPASPSLAQTGPGTRLRLAREQQNLSLAEVAHQLRLTKTMVTRLEHDNADGHAPQTFVRGYLRAYAKLLGLDDNEIVACYSKWQQAQQPQAIPKPMQPAVTYSSWGQRLLSPLLQRFWHRYKPILIIVVLLIIAGLLFNWFSSSPPVQRQSLEIEHNSQQLAEPEAEVIITTEPLTPVVLSQPVVAEPVVNNSNQLQLDLIDDCWLEIHDGNDRRIYYGLAKADEQLFFDTQAPYRLLIGNPSAVGQLQIAGEPIDLSAYPNNRTLRIELGQ